MCSCFCRIFKDVKKVVDYLTESRLATLEALLLLLEPVGVPVPVGIGMFD